MGYADYDFYRNEYFGNGIPAEDYQRLSERASDYVRAVTQGASDRVDGWQLEAVRKASCAVADVLLDEEVLMAAVYAGGQQVSSESVGGWSRSYKSAALSTAEVDNIKTRKTEAIMRCLGGLPAFSGVFGVRSYKCPHRG